MGRIGAGSAVVVLLVWLLPTTAFAMLHPQQGRFMQRDPWMRDLRRPLAGDGFADGMNAYQYIRSQPIILTDRTGKATNCGCGPDITQDLNAMLQNVDQTFAAAPLLQKARMCIGRFDAGAWDTDLFTRPTTVTNPGCPTGGPCAISTAPAGVARGAPVTIGGGCYGSYDVNYALWGRMNSLCDMEGGGEFAEALWKLKNYGGTGIVCSTQWTLYGEWWPYSTFISPPFSNFSGCKPCSAKFSTKIAWRISTAKPSWWPGGWPW